MVQSYEQPPALEVGPDLRLRGWYEDADLDAVVEHCNDPEVVRWTTIVQPYGRGDAEAWREKNAKDWADGIRAGFAIEYRGRWAGTVDLRWKEARWGDVGYGLAQWARGQGVMRRSVSALIDWGFASGELDGLGWTAYVGNIASRRVAETCGFTVEGTVRSLLIQRGKRVDAWIGSLLATDPRPA